MKTMIRNKDFFLIIRKFTENKFKKRNYIRK